MRTIPVLKTILLLCCLALTVPIAAGADGTTVSTIYPYAWAENGGWNNFKATNGNVAIYDDHLEGYVWNESVGWIKLGSHTGGGAYSYGNSAAGNWGVNLESGSLTGYGWSENGGWINFSPSGGGVSIDSATGAFDGYAWSESIGWIHFKGNTYNVRQMLNQSITFGTMPTLGKAGSTGALTATATSGLTPLFSSATPDVCGVATSSGETPNSSPSGLSWRIVASSSNGRMLLATAWSGSLYTSTDAGATWTARMTDTARNWYLAASSADGQRLTAAVHGGYIYTSTDAGATWTERTSSGIWSWSGLTSSADGLKLAAAYSGGNILTSIDGGVTWTTHAGTNWGWTSLTSSSDGNKLVAASQGSVIHYSHDGGATWTESSNSATGVWGNVASSSDGSRLICSKSGEVYISSDYGATWTQSVLPATANWFSVASSADGSRLVAAGFGGMLYISGDYGQTWNTLGVSDAWMSPALSADGSRLTVSVDGGAIHTYGDSTIITTLKAGACVINADQGGDVLYNAAPRTSSSGLYVKSSQSISFTAVPYLVAGESVAVYATATSGLIPQFSSATPDVCDVTTGSAEIPNSSPDMNWRAVASSSDGKMLLAAAWSGILYTSADAGATWTARMTDTTRNWYLTASSADGQRLTAVVFGGYIYTSTDAGATWTEHNSMGFQEWTGLASSSNGLKLTAVSAGSGIVTSIDGGATWTTRTDTSWGWTFLASSADGNKLVATVQDGPQSIYYSHDSGATWTASTSAGAGPWGNVASSRDGSMLLTSKSGGRLYRSGDSGLTWSEITAGPSASSWFSVASSSDGSRLAASESGGKLYVSKDFGATWTTLSASNTAWQSLALSSDGGRMEAAVRNGPIHIYGDSTTVTARKVGMCVINADQGGDALYDVAPQVRQAITVISAPTLKVTISGTEGSVTADGCTLAWNGSTGTCVVNNTTTTITLNTTSGTSSLFSGWSGGAGAAAICAGTGSCSFTLSENSEVTAVFSPAYSVTPTAQTGGSISPSSVVKVFPNSTTSFTIRPDRGYGVVTPVDGTCGGTYTENTYTTNAVTANCTVAAAFIPGVYSTPYSVTIGSGASTGGAWFGTSPAIWTPGASGSTVSINDIKDYLNTGTRVVIATNFGDGSQEGNIILNSPLSWNSGNLTLDAARDIIVNAAMTPSANASLDMNGPVTVRGSLVIDKGATVVIYGVPPVSVSALPVGAVYAEAVKLSLNRRL